VSYSETAVTQIGAEVSYSETRTKVSYSETPLLVLLKICQLFFFTQIRLKLLNFVSSYSDSCPKALLITNPFSSEEDRAAITAPTTELKIAATTVRLADENQRRTVPGPSIRDERRCRLR